MRVYVEREREREMSFAVFLMMFAGNGHTSGPPICPAIKDRGASPEGHANRRAGAGAGYKG